MEANVAATENNSSRHPRCARVRPVRSGLELARVRDGAAAVPPRPGSLRRRAAPRSRRRRAGGGAGARASCRSGRLRRRDSWQWPHRHDPHRRRLLRDPRPPRVDLRQAGRRRRGRRSRRDDPPVRRRRAARAVRPSRCTADERSERLSRPAAFPSSAAGAGGAAPAGPGCGTRAARRGSVRAACTGPACARSRGAGARRTGACGLGPGGARCRQRARPRAGRRSSTGGSFPGAAAGFGFAGRRRCACCRRGAAVGGRRSARAHCLRAKGRAAGDAAASRSARTEASIGFGARASGADGRGFCGVAPDARARGGAQPGDGAGARAPQHAHFSRRGSAATARRDTATAADLCTADPSRAARAYRDGCSGEQALAAARAARRRPRLRARVRMPAPPATARRGRGGCATGRTYHLS